MHVNIIITAILNCAFKKNCPKLPKWHHSDSHSRHVKDVKSPNKHCLDAKTQFGVFLPDYSTFFNNK